MSNNDAQKATKYDAQKTMDEFYAQDLPTADWREHYRKHPEDEDELP